MSWVTEDSRHKQKSTSPAARLGRGYTHVHAPTGEVSVDLREKEIYGRCAIVGGMRRRLVGLKSGEHHFVLPNPNLVLGANSSFKVFPNV